MVEGPSPPSLKNDSPESTVVVSRDSRRRGTCRLPAIFELMAHARTSTNERRNDREESRYRLYGAVYSRLETGTV